MRKIMIRRSFLLLSVILVLFNTGCVKETYNMNMLSKEAHLSPTLAISAVKGDVSLSDMVKTNDTVIFDQNNLVKIVFKKDSVIDMKMSDFYDLSNMVSYSDTYILGELALAPFQYTNGFTLKEISSNFALPLKAQFLLLDDGAPHLFPPFPSTDLGEKTFSFTNFENAVFSSGFIDISVTNNLTAPLNSINVGIFNTSGHAAIGSAVTIPAIAPGQTQTASVNLSGQTVTNSIIAAIVLSGSPGTTTPVLIDLNNSNIQVTLKGRDLLAKSGRVIIPEQPVTSYNNKDTVSFDPGSGIEIDILKILTGNFSYKFQSSCALKGSFDITLPSVLRAGIPFKESITVNPNSITNGTLPVNNTVFDLGTDPGQPYNRVPMETSIFVKSDGLMVNFNSTDKIKFDLRLPGPVFDYIKGYFGQQVQSITPDSIDLDIKEILDHITGSFLISSPSITINYSNSFALPVQVTLNAAGIKKAETVNLDLSPFLLTYPAAPAVRDVSASYVVDKSNSSLPELISMPPEYIRFSGSAKMNPAGNDGLRNNYVFDKSRFIGSLEFEIPLDFRMNNLQFTDTVDNFIKNDNTSSNSSLKPEDIEFLRVDVSAKNGFPLGASLQMSLYDTVNHVIKSTVNATDILKPAPVDGNGKATAATETSTSIEFTSEFFKSINTADQIIFRFTLNTTDNGTKDVRIYSDYRIDFKAALVVKPDIKLK
jgi:hypothetical protein